jgi:outer membrane protein OmpA-like peptidoglycan-associated protein
MLRKRATEGRHFPQACLRGARASLSIAALIAMLCGLSACTTLRPRPPTTPPPARPPHSVPITPPATPAPVAPVPEPRSYEQDANDAKQALLKNDHDSLPATDVGYYLDVLHGRLKQLASANIGVARNGKLIVIVLAGVTRFEAGSAELSAAMRDALARLSAVLVEYRQTTVAVRVRGDDAGAKTSDPALADQRRLAVANALAGAGIVDKRIVLATAPARAPATKGKSSPLRVELQLEPIVRPTATGH